MLRHKILIDGRVLSHCAISLASTVLYIDYIIVYSGCASLACGFDLTSTLHTTVLSTSRDKRHYKGYDKNIFHTANIRNADKISAEKLANDLYLHVV